MELLIVVAAMALAALSYLLTERAMPRRFRRRELIRNWGRLSSTKSDRARFGAISSLLGWGLPRQVLASGQVVSLPAGLGSPERVIIVRLALSGLGLGIGLLAPWARGKSPGWALGFFLAGGAWAALPLLVGVMLDNWRARIVRTFPGMVQTLSLLAGTGLTTIQAFRAAIPCIREPLRSEVKTLVAELSSSLVPEDALERFANRTGVPEIRAFTRMIAQERKAGIRLGEILAKQATFARRLRVQLIRKKTSLQPYLLTLTVGLLFLNLFIIYMIPRAVDFLRFLDQ